jgi:hypothetical protein
MIRHLLLLTLVAPIALAGCQSTTYTGGEPKLIARDRDTGFGDAIGPRHGVAALAVTPDGCHAWIMDDGLEGYATTRSDPRTGLPICSSQYPPGSVIGRHTISDDIPDYLP